MFLPRSAEYTNERPAFIKIYIALLLWRVRGFDESSGIQ